MKLNKENPSPDVFDSKKLTEGWATPAIYEYVIEERDGKIEKLKN